MAADQKDRVKASKLRAAKAKGKSLKPADEQWLTQYTIRTAKRTRANVGTHTPTKKAAPVVRGPQLALQGGELAAAPPPAHAHETKPFGDDKRDPMATTWSPVVPEAPADAPPPPPGGAPPPIPGTPIADGPAAAAAPTGDPAVAAQFALAMQALVMAGWKGADELLADVELPEVARAAFEAPEAREHTKQAVGQAAYNVSMKRGWKVNALTDEGVLVTAALASTAAIGGAALKRRRKALAEANENAPTENVPETPPPPQDLAARLRKGGRG